MDISERESRCAHWILSALSAPPNLVLTLHGHVPPGSTASSIKLVAKEAFAVAVPLWCVDTVCGNTCAHTSKSKHLSRTLYA